MQLTLLAPLALPVLVPISDSPRLVHGADQSITRAWTVTSTRTIDSATLVLMDNEQDVGSGSTRSSEVTLEVTDDVTKVEGGRATALHRVFDSIQLETANQGLEESETMTVRDNSGTSELEGLGVLFTYDEDAELWSSAFDEDSPGDDEWLEGLSVPMDLQRLLPTDDDGELVEVAVGDSWDVDSELLEDFLSPGGEVHVVPEEDDDTPEGGIAIVIPSVGDSGHWGEVGGDVVATYEKLVEADGKRLARIVVTVDLDGEIDMTAELEDAASERGVDESYSEAGLELTLEGELVVLWNLDANRPESVEGKLSGTELFSTEWSLAHQTMELEMGYSAEGTVEYAVSATFSN